MVYHSNPITYLFSIEVFFTRIDSTSMTTIQIVTTELPVTKSLVLDSNQGTVSKKKKKETFNK